MRTQPKILANREAKQRHELSALFSLLALLSIASLSACSGPVTDPEPIAELTQALNVCEEAVPANRFVDGFPAYAQCASTNSSAIWSSNGIDTALTSQGTGWIRTQRSGGYQCTEWAWRYMHFRWGVDYQNGNAGSWCDGNLPATLAKVTTPVHGDLIVFAPGVCGSDGTTGHIAVIDVVNAGAGTVTLVEENSAGRRNSKMTCATCFLHAVANDGTGSGGAAGGSGVGGAASAGGSTSAGGASSSGGRAQTGGTPSTGGAGPVTMGGVSSGGATHTGGVVSAGGTFGTTGGVVGSSGTPGSTGGSLSTGGNPVTGGVSSNPMSTGGTATGGTPGGVVTGGTPSSSGSPGQVGAGAPGGPADPLSTDITSGCGVSRGAPRAGFQGYLGQFALALVGFALRRRALRRRGSSHAA